MKSITRVFICLPVIILAVTIYSLNTGSLYSKSAGAPNFVSGSVYDVATCALSGCHNTYPVKNTPTHWISSNVPSTGYLPGVTYTVTCKAVSTISGQNSNFGFECTPENKSGKLIGTLANIVTSGAGATQIISSSPSKWVTHTSSSYQATDSNSWSFRWTAPNPAVGAVEFYSTFNCGSSDSRSTAQIYRDSIHINQDSAAGIYQPMSDEANVNIYPNPAKERITISYALGSDAEVSIDMISMDGKKIYTLIRNRQTAGSQSNTLQLPDGIAPGVYAIEISVNNRYTVHKILVL